MFIRLKLDWDEYIEIYSLVPRSSRNKVKVVETHVQF